MAIITDIEDLSKALDVARVGFFNQYEYGNLGMINANHNNQYPILHLLPPQSTLVEPFKNSESLICVFHCYRTLINDTTVGVNAQEYMIERTHDFLYNQFVGTMQALTLSNEHKWVMTSQWSIERVMEEFNDGLVGIIVTCQVDKFSHCLKHIEDTPTPSYTP